VVAEITYILVIFHQRAAGCAKKNRIKSLKTPDGRETMR
jgi:hypothetical protein